MTPPSSWEAGRGDHPAEAARFVKLRLEWAAMKSAFAQSLEDEILVAKAQSPATHCCGCLAEAQLLGGRPQPCFSGRSSWDSYRNFVESENVSDRQQFDWTMLTLAVATDSC